MALLDHARQAVRRLVASRRLAALLPVLAGMLGAAIAVGAFARQDARIGPLTVRLAARPALLPSSTLVIPPFGAVSAATHRGPLAFRATLDNVDVPALEGLIRRYASRDDQSRDSLEQAQRCALGGVLGVGIMLVPALLTFRVSAFETPEFTGALQYAPALVGDVRSFPERLDTLRQEMARIATNLDRAYAALGQPVPDLGPGTVRVLHISDLHLNPAGFDLAERQADQFQVDAVVDTGDMGTWGLPFERSVPQQVKRFRVPYLFVKGNHDSDQMVAAIAAAGGQVLDHEATTVDGVRFYGVGDPTFSPGKGYRTDELEALKRRRSVTVADELDALSRPADVLLVHDPALATYATGHVATVLDGHLHRFGTRVDHGTRELTDATTGAAGPDGLRQQHPPPYGAEIVYFDATSHRPIAVDRITVRSLEAEFSVQRLRLAEGDMPFARNPATVPEGDSPRPGDATTITAVPSTTG